MVRKVNSKLNTFLDGTMMTTSDIILSTPESPSTPGVIEPVTKQIVKRGKKSTINPVLYVVAAAALPPVHQLRRDTIITLPCTTEQIDQCLASDWFHTNPNDPLPIPETTTNIESTTSTPIIEINPDKSVEKGKSDYVHKLHDLKIQMYTSGDDCTSDLKISDCFWCTCAYDTEPCFVLKYGHGNDIQGRGSYCSPECAVAGLFNHTGWDDSEKFESYQLMNFCYQMSTTEPNTHAPNKLVEKSIRTNICPAVSPYYFLEKFFGNMTPTEFREMNRQSKHLLYTIDRPLTRILPEIHEEKELVLPRANVLGSGKYRVKRQCDQIQATSQADIMRQQFNLN